MRPLIYTDFNDFTKVKGDNLMISVKRFNEILNEVYEAGVKDGIAKANTPYMIGEDFSEKLNTMDCKTVLL